MIVRSVLGVIGAVALAGVFMVSTVEAKPCPKICRDVIVACKAKCTTKPKGKCKKKCTSTAVKFCKQNNKTCPTSVSGAFLLD